MRHLVKKKITVLFCISHSTTFQRWKELVLHFQIPSLALVYSGEHRATSYMPTLRHSKCYKATSAIFEALNNCET